MPIPISALVARATRRDSREIETRTSGDLIDITNTSRFYVAISFAPACGIRVKNVTLTSKGTQLKDFNEYEFLHEINV